MRKFQAILAACCAATLLLGLAPHGPAASAVGAKANIGDLKPDYFGVWSSTNGENEGGNADFDVTGTKGTQFGGTLEMLTNLSRGAEAEGFLDTNVGGSVNTKGKLKMSSDLGEGFKFNYKGQLSDQGIIIQGGYTVKQGKKTIKQGAMTFIVD